MVIPEFYVSPPPPGVDPVPEGSGTLEDPYHLIAQGITAAADGGFVYLRGGTYVESINLTGVKGTDSVKLVVKPYKLERVTIDSTVAEFRGASFATDWQPVTGHPGEYESTRRFEQVPGARSTVVRKGAFLNAGRYTRLVTYDRVEDLRSPNQLWPNPEDLADNPDQLGPDVSHEQLTDDDQSFAPKRRYRPFVYMGPGIWFDESDDGRRVHIRLSHTSNLIDGWPDYTGKTDPRQLRLALSTAESHVLRLVTCEHMVFQNLTLRFGDEDTVRLRNCTDITFDHVRVWATSRGIRLQTESENPGEANTDIEVKHCLIDGGLPTWFFRSDRKDTYRFRPAPDAAVVENRLGASTGGVLLSSDEGAVRVSVHHCEIVNGHDISVAFGDQMRFHHNWVHNINDDSMIVAGVPGTKDARIYQNVITQCLTALSFAGGGVGQISIFRNLIDIRRPTLGNRPRSQTEQRSLRHGQFYKDGTDEGPFDLFHNTCIVLDPGAVGAAREEIVLTAFGHYKPLGPAGRRRAYNNIFVAVYSRPGEARTIAFLPPSEFPGPTDGNTYHRFGTGPEKKFFVTITGDPDHFDQYPDLADYVQAESPQEQNGQSNDPAFKSLDTPGSPQPGDDLRLKAESTARDSAVPLPDELQEMDIEAGGFWFRPSRDRGCYRHPAERLRVGVDGRRRFPPLT
ncbi:hypothetical protein [Kribbella sp. NPDC049227]|uniref:hypothetical protein n=1 Tax=Kribbella sp. NPDC049227 TaxID=3364113 RepID=UPI0037200277